MHRQRHGGRGAGADAACASSCRSRTGESPDDTRRHRAPPPTGDRRHRHGPDAWSWARCSSWASGSRRNMRANITALQTASALQAYPEEIAHQLNTLRDRLEVRAYSGQALRRPAGHGASASTRTSSRSTRPATATPRSSAARCCCGTSTPRCSIRSSPSAASRTSTQTARGSSLSREGREHYAEVKRAQLFAADNARPLQAQLVSARHHAAAHLLGAPPRGCARCCSPACSRRWCSPPPPPTSSCTRARHERAARDAQEQTRDILKTVREGFFLLDANYRIGSVWSEALTRMFSRNDFAGLSFEELLQNLRAGRHAGDRHQVHQAALGRPRSREPDEEHQPAGAARDHHG